MKANNICCYAVLLILHKAVITLKFSAKIQKCKYLNKSNSKEQFHVVSWFFFSRLKIEIWNLTVLYFILSALGSEIVNAVTRRENLLMSQSQQVKNSVSRSTQGIHNCYSILKGLLQTNIYQVKDPVLSIMLHAPLLLSLFVRERGFYCFPGFCFPGQVFNCVERNSNVSCFWSL